MSSKQRSEERVVEMTQRVATTYRVFIADRDSMSNDLLARALVRDSRYEAFAVPPSDLLRLLATREADVVIVGADLNSDSGGTLELASAVCRAHPNIYVVILLNQTTRELVINAFRIGARGVFSRERPMIEFLDCVEHVGKGFIWAGKREATDLLDAIKNIPAPALLTAKNTLPLTARELQTVQCAARGKTNKAIASELGLSEHTVKNYLFRAFEKLGVSSRVELLLYLTVRGYTFSETSPNALDIDSDVE
jgi:two-component system, NarL family, nitrate/nitrite response regulator NarL